MKRIGVLLLVLAPLLAACSGETLPAPTLIPEAVPTPAGTDTEIGGGALAAVVQGGALPDERPAWQSAALTDARSGQTFNLLAFGGKTIYVQPFAVGCAACLPQLDAINQAYSRVDPANYAFVVVSADAPEALAAFASERGYAWTFATAGVDFFAGITVTFGAGITALETVPRFLISPTGAISTLSTGSITADDLIAQLAAASGA